MARSWRVASRCSRASYAAVAIHRWRARACAILTGIGTVRDDDPQLNVRAVQTPRQPLKVLIDSRVEASPGAKLFNDAKVLIFAGEVIRPFAWVMAFGVFTGTFSSIYVASPLLMWIEHKYPRPVESGKPPVATVSRASTSGAR